MHNIVSWQKGAFGQPCIREPLLIAIESSTLVKRSVASSKARFTSAQSLLCSEKTSGYSNSWRWFAPGLL